MEEERGKTKFDVDLAKSLEQRGYTIYEEDKMKGIKYTSKPDMIAIKDKTALIIETKSEKESKDSGCLTYRNNSAENPHPYYKKSLSWRDYCNSISNKDAAIWMVHINLQALFYPIFFQKCGENKPGGWRMRDDTVNVELEECTRIPALAFPESYKKHVQEALRIMRIMINESAFMELGLGQLLLKFDSRQMMIEQVPYVGNRKT